jgi:hypothetical protein
MIVLSLFGFWHRAVIHGTRGNDNSYLVVRLTRD